MRIFGLALLLLFAACPAYALDVKGLRFGRHDDTQRIVIELSASAKFKTYILSNPDRIVLDLPNFKWDVSSIQKPDYSLISDIRHGAVGPQSARVILQTATPAKIISSFMIAADSKQPDRIVIDLKKESLPSDILTSDAKVRKYSANTVQNLADQLPLPKTVEAPISDHKIIPAHAIAKPRAKEVAANAAVQSLKSGAAKVAPYETAAGTEEAPETIDQPKIRNHQKPLIIIDPGHGGQDPGAHAINGNYEKTIVLAVGLELKKLLEQSGQYRVQMTRDTDIFIPLHDRVKFARKEGGDLFVSLHADSMPNSTVSGASVYTLSDTASDKETEKLAERENKSDAIAGVNLSNQDSDVANILIDLASRDTMNQSRYLANTVVSTMPAQGVNMLERQPHRSAGFAVLKAMDIPSILVEMGYLTNMDEANRLSSQMYRHKVATGLKASVDAYFTKVAKLTTP